jgi:8-oxo-dGTP diphosphatase
MIREAKEEIGITIQKEDLITSCIMHRNSPDKEFIDFFFMARKYEGEIKNAEPDKCDDVQFFPLDQLPKNIIPYVKHGIEASLKGEKYVEYGW